MTVLCMRDGLRMVALSDDCPWSLDGKAALVIADCRSRAAVEAQGEVGGSELAKYLREEMTALNKGLPGYLLPGRRLLERWLAGE